RSSASRTRPRTSPRSRRSRSRRSSTATCTRRRTSTAGCTSTGGDEGIRLPVGGTDVLSSRAQRGIRSASARDQPQILRCAQDDPFRQPAPGDPMAVITYREALGMALAEEMDRDPDVFLMGEEVGVYNGAYKVSKGLLDRFGEMRVVDTPITELGFAGLGVGAAMT